MPQLHFLPTLTQILEKHCRDEPSHLERWSLRMRITVRFTHAWESESGEDEDVDVDVRWMRMRMWMWMWMRNKRNTFWKFNDAHILLPQLITKTTRPKRNLSHFIRRGPENAGRKKERRAGRKRDPSDLRAAISLMIDVTSRTLLPNGFGPADCSSSRNWRRDSLSPAVKLG